MGSKTNTGSLGLSPKTWELLKKEEKYSVGGFRPPPAFIERAEGVYLWVWSSNICRFQDDDLTITGY